MFHQTLLLLFYKAVPKTLTLVLRSGVFPAEYIICQNYITMAA